MTRLASLAAFLAAVTIPCACFELALRNVEFLAGVVLWGLLGGLFAAPMLVLFPRRERVRPSIAARIAYENWQIGAYFEALARGENPPPPPGVRPDSRVESGGGGARGGVGGPQND